MSAFSEPHGRVGILAWPTILNPLDTTHRLAAVEAPPDESRLAAASPTPVSAAAEAIAAITAQHRTPIRLDLATVTTLATVAADAGADPALSCSSGQWRLVEAAVSPPPPQATASTARSRSGREPVAPLDLIISSVAPMRVDAASAASVTLAAGPALRLGGILTVLTHSHHIEGRLLDPGGRLVSAAQNADLLYLQHIVVRPTPTAETPTAEASAASPAGGAPAAVGPRPWPVRHRRTHADLYVFGQPHDHHTPDNSALHDDAASTTRPAATPGTGEAR